MWKILRQALGLVKTVILGASVDGDEVVVRVRPHRREQLRCSDEQPAVPWEDRKEEKKKADARKARDRKRDRERRKRKALRARDFKLEP